MTRCPKCNHLRTAQDINPEWECPSCGVAYSKAINQTPPSSTHGSAQVNLPTRRESAPGLLQRLFSAPVLLLLALGLGAYWYTSHPGKSNTQPLGPQLEAEEQVVIYSTSQCATCRRAKDYFRMHNIAYTEYNVEESIEYRKKFYEIGGKAVPLLLIKGKRMTGFDPARFEHLYQ